MKSSEQEKQRQLLQSVFGRDTRIEFDRGGINVYRRNLQASAARALTISYPTIAALLGDQLMSMLAAHLVAQNGKREYDWGLWGADFPGWLDQHPISEEHAYLGDSARLDWAVHLAERSADKEPDLPSFQALESMGSYDFSLEFAAGAAVVDSNYPIVTIYDAHRDNARYPDLKPTIEKLKKGVGESALVWRPRWRTQVRVAAPDEAAWLGLIGTGRMLSDVIAAQTDDTVGLERWLPSVIEQQLVIGLRA